MFESCTITQAKVAVYTVPIDAPEADGNSTTMVLVRLEAGDERGTGYTYADAATGALVQSLLDKVVQGKDVFGHGAIPQATYHQVRNMIGEVDVFQLSSADELYAHMNINYLRLPELPSFDHYDRILHAIEKGDGFITTGEILLPSTSMSAEGDRSIRVKATVSSTFPLRIAEVSWGDGVRTHRQVMDLQSTPAFDNHEYTWLVDTPGWTWARFAVWDVAGDGAFTNPVWRDHR